MYSTYYHAGQRLWLKIFFFYRCFPTNGCNKLLASLKASCPMRTFGRVGPSVLANALPGVRLRIFACGFFYAEVSF